MLQYEQYEQEVKNLQRLIEEAHRIIQDRPVSTNNIQELQAQIHHHEVCQIYLLIHTANYIMRKKYFDATFQDCSVFSELLSNSFKVLKLNSVLKM